MPEEHLAVCAADLPRHNQQIPFVDEQFSAMAIMRQFTLSYRLLPTNRRNAAQYATRKTPG